MPWDAALAAITPHVVKIETPNNYGTGFLVFHNHDNTWSGVATAAHVVRFADEWQQPIKIIANDQAPRFLPLAERVIFIDRFTDSAVVLFLKGNLQLPQSPIALLPMEQPCGIGADVGWLGFPNIEADTLCFFSGAISARKVASKAYLIDGVAINGVSGGPVFTYSHLGVPQIIGCVTAYQANRATGEALPGLLRAQDVSHFHQVAAHVRNIDEGQRQKREFEVQQQQINRPSEVAGC